jgi:neutral ceramidase
VLSLLPPDEYPYQIGVGIYDVTGPAAQVGMMGYAMLNQRTSGLHFRLRARAYMVVPGNNTKNTLTFVNMDLCFTTHAVKTVTLERLNVLYPNEFTHQNVLITATHTHAGPGGYSWYSIYDMTTFGFEHDNFNAIVDGIVKAITMARKNLQKGKLFVNQGDLVEPVTNRNRSPTAYNNNEDAKNFKYDTDKFVITLRFEGEKNKELGVIAWFPVHGVSMNNINYLISGDNKGYASYLFEKKKNNASLPGIGPFVAAFAQSNEGDVTPNTRGAQCDNGEPCETAHSTCNGRSQGCHGYGPGNTDYESTKIIGTQQYEMARKLYEDRINSIELNGNGAFVHSFVKMDQMNIDPEFTGLKQTIKTCIGALGDSFAGGTTDGPGDFDFEQGTNSSKINPYWNFISSFLSNPTEEQKKCHEPKPILLYVGPLKYPTQWVPNILPMQIFRIDKLFIIAVPSEFTTMAGRRLRETVKKYLIKNGAATSDSIFVISGLSNSYSQYVTTHEEYVYQRYEGASTLFGPYTLAYYQQEYAKLAEYLAKGIQAPPGPTPIDYRNNIVSLNPPHLLDDGPFGDLIQDVKPRYQVNSIVKVIFYTGCPRNNFHIQGTFLNVERWDPNNRIWKVVAVDGDWETRYQWESHISFPEIAESYATITWEIPPDAEPGTYRIVHFGDWKAFWTGTITPFTGHSSNFTVSR